MRTLTTAFSLFCFAGTAAAQGLPGVCGKLSDVSVGQFAEYRVNAPQIGLVDMRIAIVGTEDVGGAAFQWHEMKINMPQGEMVMQMLVPRFPYEPGDVTKLVMKGPGQPAMELPSSMMAMMKQQGGNNFASDIAKSCEMAERVGTESVTVPAGSFDAEHYRVTTPDSAEAWISTDVPFGIIKMTGPDGISMELIGHGQDATSSITEAPQKPGSRK